MQHGKAQYMHVHVNLHLQTTCRYFEAPKPTTNGLNLGIKNPLELQEVTILAAGRGCSLSNLFGIKTAKNGIVTLLRCTKVYVLIFYKKDVALSLPLATSPVVSWANWFKVHLKTFILWYPTHTHKST